MNNNDRILNRLNGVLSLLEAGPDALISHLDVLLIALFTGKNPNKMNNTAIKELILELIDQIKTGTNYIRTEEKGTLIGNATYVSLSNSIGDITGLVLHHFKYLIAPNENPKGETVIQKLMSLPKGTIMNILNCACGNLSACIQDSVNDDSSIKRLENTDMLSELTGDDEFVLYINDIVILGYADYETGQPMFYTISKLDNTFKEMEFEDINLYLNIEED